MRKSFRRVLLGVASFPVFLLEFSILCLGAAAAIHGLLYLFWLIEGHPNSYREFALELLKAARGLS